MSFALVAGVILCGLAIQAAEIRLIAHRGGVVDSQFAENSPGAVEEAIRRGYWMIEVDLQPSRDGRLVLHHDENFLRFYGEPARVAELTWDRIVRLRARPGGSRPLQFHELAALACGRIRLMLDLKASAAWTSSHYQQIESVLRENDLLESAIFISNDQAKAYFQGKA
ncbi:MAG: glycerophosphodiester phosphodiesterase, partial [Bryobacteraceae bacterium]